MIRSVIHHDQLCLYPTTSQTAASCGPQVVTEPVGGAVVQNQGRLLPDYGCQLPKNPIEEEEEDCFLWQALLKKSCPGLRTKTSRPIWVTRTLRCFQSSAECAVMEKRKSEAVPHGEENNPMDQKPPEVNNVLRGSFVQWTGAAFSFQLYFPGWK